MKTVIFSVLMVLSAQLAHADADDRARPLGYGQAKDIMFLACETAQDYREVEPQCKALVARMNSGHAIRESDYLSWCGMVKGYGDKLTQYEKDYKHTYGKNLDYRKCPR